MKTKAVLLTTTSMHCKDRQVLRDLFSINKGNWITKLNLKVLSVIAMCSHLYPVWLVSRVLKSTISRNTFQWLLPNIAFAIWKTRLRNLHYVQCLNIAPMEKAWFMALMEKELWPQWNIPSYFTAPMEKVWFSEILFFQVVIVMVKDKKRCTIKDTMTIKTSFVHYRNYIMWTRVKLPVVFLEFDMFYIFWLRFFLFSITVS